MPASLQPPLRYDSSIETPEPDETQTGHDLVDTMRGISETTYRDGGHALRSVHAKSHGLIEAELEILSGLPPALAQGIAAKPGRYPAVMRFSTIPGDVLHDGVSTPRGLALKLIGVEGDRLPGSEGDATQDFLMADAPAFSAPNAKAFLKNLKLLAGTTDKVEGLKRVLSAVLRPVEAALESVAGPSPLITTLGGHPANHILGNTFYSQVPLLWGEYIAKVSVAPVSANLLALVDAKVDIGSQPNGLREAVQEFFEGQTGEWELRVQLCTDLATMPVEDASVRWPEEESPYVAVARIRAKPQVSWSQARSAAVDDGLAFSPWHGLAAHRPLGSIMRVRKASYEMSSGFRASHNGCPIAEPRSRVALPA